MEMFAGLQWKVQKHNYTDLDIPDIPDSSYMVKYSHLIIRATGQFVGFIAHE